MALTTNAASLTLAAELASARHATFTGIVTRKVGVTRGSKTFGDDLVHAVILTGFNYRNLVSRSLADLTAMTDEKCLTVVQAKLPGATMGMALAARDDLVTSFEATLNGTNESTTDHVFDPLMVDGAVIAGARVYKCVANDPAHRCHCRDCTGDKKAPVNGQINMSGLRIATKVLEAAVNGPVPASSSAPATIAKDALRSRLPVSRYVSYRLDPKGDWVLRAGGAAAVAAANDAVAIDPAHIDSALNNMTV